MDYTNTLNELFRRYPDLEVCRASVTQATATLCDTFFNGGKLLVCGNGGSAADAGHIAGELMKSFLLPRYISEGISLRLAAFGEEGKALAAKLEQGLPVISLAAHEALMTAVANDTAAETVFAQQVVALGKEGDALLAISTSGNSKNCVAAAMIAKALGMKVIALTGAGGGRLAAFADTLIAVPEKETFKVQEYHLPIYHAICAAIEKNFYGV